MSQSKIISKINIILTKPLINNHSFATINKKGEKMWLTFNDFMNYVFGIGFVFFTFAMIINYLKAFARAD